MTTYTLDDLLSPDSPDDAATALFTELFALGFPTTNWADDSVPVALVRTVAKAMSEQAYLARDMAAGGLLALSTGPWLDLLAASAYGLTRNASGFATVRVRITCTAGFGPVTVNPYAYTMRRLTDGLRWTSQNAGAVIVPDGGSLVVDFKAESPGAKYGALLGQVIALVTPVPGISIAFEDAGAGSPIVTAGTDEEKDSVLQARCSARWDTIGVQKTSVAYASLCQSAGVTSVTRLYVDDVNPRGPGTVDVWLASATGALGAGDLATINTYLQARKSPSTNLQVSNAAQVIIDITATVSCEAGASVVAQAVEGLTTLINNVPIGGVLYRDEIIEALVAPSGARKASVLQVYKAAALQPGDITLTASQIAVVGTLNITQAAL